MNIRPRATYAYRANNDQHDKKTSLKITELLIQPILGEELTDDLLTLH